jgi:Family of unknown function (DUF5654)
MPTEVNDTQVVKEE